jgi:hypothetical protein
MKRLILSLIFFMIYFELQAASTNEYKINLEYDTINRNFKGELFLTWQNVSNQSVYELPFHFLVDSSNPKISCELFDKNECSIKVLNNGFVLKLSKPIKPSASTEIHIKFETRKRLNYLDLGTGDYLLPTIQFFDEQLFNPDFQIHSNYKVTIKVPKGFEIATTGKINQKENIANSFLNIYTEAKDVPTYGIVISKKFRVKETKTKNGILIRSVYLEGEEYWGEKIMNYAKDVIEFYVDTLGFYPQDQISLIPGETGNASGGWPIFPNIVAIHRGGLKRSNADSHAQWIIAHEIGHQYWGFNYILDPTNYPQWFGISMGLYTDRLYVFSRKIDQSYDFWYSDYIEGVKNGYNTTIMQLVDTLNKKNFNWNSIIMHGKSFVILRMLAKETGENKFYEIFQYCLKNYKGINVTLDLFQKTCEKVTKKDLEWFFNQWYRTNDYLDYQIQSVETIQEGNKFQTSCIINRKGNATMTKIDIALIAGDSEMIFDSFDGKQMETRITFNSENVPGKIVIDPKNELTLLNRKEWIKTNQR